MKTPPTTLDTMSTRLQNDTTTTQLIPLIVDYNPYYFDTDYGFDPNWDSSSKRVSRSGGGGGGGGPTCFNIGYSEPTRAESREGSSTPGVVVWEYTLGCRLGSC